MEGSLNIGAIGALILPDCHMKGFEAEVLNPNLRLLGLRALRNQKWYRQRMPSNSDDLPSS